METQDNSTIISPDTRRVNRLPPGQRLTSKWPLEHYGPVYRTDPSKWKLRLFGEVEKERTITWSEFTALPQIKVFSDIHCVTTWSKLDNLWEGVSAAELKKLVNISPAAKHVIAHAEGGFTTNIPIDEFFQPDVLLAVKHDDQPITAEHGGPVRLVVPRLYFWKSAKWLTGIEFKENDEPGFWESHGYHNHGDPWIEERYS